MRKIIGLVGETGAGKDLFRRFAQKIRKDVFCFRFVDPLNEILEILFGKIKKEDQQQLGPILREKFGKDILIRVLASRIKKVKKGIIILNGARFWEEQEIVKELGGKIIYITADSKIRWQRLKKRGEKKDDSMPYENFLRLEKAKTEVLIPEVGKKADFKIENNGSKEDFKKKVAKIIKVL